MVGIKCYFWTSLVSLFVPLSLLLLSHSKATDGDTKQKVGEVEPRGFNEKQGWSAVRTNQTQEGGLMDTSANVNMEIRAPTYAAMVDVNDPNYQTLRFISNKDVFENKTKSPGWFNRKSYFS
ncbi:hypothetical protein Tcan_07231 [Toxocara canis]|uniref:Uncharacterized protein n=1 Tax=Toxocara canis TaxID=6265 RepID=A0A0B2UTW9_TOXCA|nr:hypothetical protein Tcan_07231 [Toxocara canis]